MNFLGKKLEKHFKMDLIKLTEIGLLEWILTIFFMKKILKKSKKN